MKTRFVIPCAASLLLCLSAAGQWLIPPPGAHYDPYAPGGYFYPARPAGAVSDLEIRNNLTRAFFEDQMLNSVGIRIRISNGVVTLLGKADTSEAVVRAMRHAYDAGAQSVISQLRVGP